MRPTETSSGQACARQARAGQARGGRARAGQVNGGQARGGQARPGQPSGGQGGFTLLEVMIAFVIAALALSMLYQGATGGLRATASATRTEEAVSLAKSHLAALGRGEGIAPQESSGIDGDGFEWHLHVAPIGTRHLTLTDADRANDSKPSDAILFDVRLTESWTDAGHPHQIVIGTHRLDIHTTEGQ